MTDRYSYDAYGMLLAGSGASANPYRYRGEQYDSDLESYYLRARYYQPGTGRFLTTDPVEGGLSIPMTRHRYVYGNVDPINHIDPSGKISLTNVISGVAILSNLFAIGADYFPILQDVYADLGEALFPDAYTLGVNAQLSMNFPILNDLLGVTWAVHNENKEVLMSVSSAEIAVFSVKAYGGAYLGFQDFVTASFSLYRGLVWNLWNAQDYSGPFVSLQCGDFALAFSPTARSKGAWGLSQSKSWQLGRGASPITTAYTMYTLDGKPKTFPHEIEVALITHQVSMMVALLWDAINNVDPAVALTKILVNGSLWYQTYKSQYYYNRKYDYSVDKRQKTDRPKHFVSGPGDVFLTLLGLL